MRISSFSFCWFGLLDSYNWILIVSLCLFGFNEVSGYGESCEAPCLYVADDTCTNPALVNTKSWKCSRSSPQDSSLERIQGNLNSSFKVSNGTKQWFCKYYSALEAPGNATAEVLLANETWLFSLFKSQNQSHGCCLVFFFVRWCKFCAEIAADYNSLARFYPGLPIIAIDAGLYPGVATKFGVVGVPTILLFYGGRPVIRLNKSRPNLHHFEKFIKHHAGFSPTMTLATEEQDFNGPLLTSVEEAKDVCLYLSLAFLLVLVVGYSVTVLPINTMAQVAGDTLINLVMRR